MTYRLLPPTEWHRLAGQFEAHGSRVPLAGSKIAVAEDAGQIVGFLVLQWVPHAEPLVVSPEYQGEVYWPMLLRLVEDELHGGTYYAFTPNERIARFAELSGMKPLPWAIYEKSVA